MQVATIGGRLIVKNNRIGTTCGCCNEGACCEADGSCSVKPQNQCQGPGQTFKGVGTLCTPGICDPCNQVCPSTATPPQTIYLTISNYQATFAFLEIGNLDGTYALARTFGSCNAFSASSYINDCIGTVPTFCGFSGCTHKFYMGVSPDAIQIYAFDNTGFHFNINFTPRCVGFSLFHEPGFDVCTQTSQSGSTATGVTSNVVEASFNYEITVTNPLP